MFDLFSDPVKVAQQLQIISAEFGGALWETMYALILEMIFAYAIGLPLGVPFSLSSLLSMVVRPAADL